MYESQIVEVEDFNFCHYINHFEDFDSDSDLTYDEMFELQEVSMELNEDSEYSEF